MIKSEKTHFDIQSATHAGMLGKQNEDRFAVTHFWIDSAKNQPSTLAVLCDGIGGHRAGEVAAEMGVTLITEAVAAGDPDEPLETLEKAITRASQAIYQASTKVQGRLGMGATCACAWVIDDRLFTVNLGDSRIYLLRDNHIIQLTTDHTWIQEAMDAGIFENREPANHPNAHVIRRYLGSESPPQPDFRMWVFEGEGNEEALANQGLQLIPGDVLLLCSDGLTDLVSDDEIREVVRSLPFDEVPGRLVSLANMRGGHDNTTVIVMRDPRGQRKLLGKKRKRWALGCLAGLALLSAVFTVTIFGIRWRQGAQREQATLSPDMTLTLPIDLTPTDLDPSPSPSATPTTAFTETEAKPLDLSTRTPWPTHTMPP